MGHGVRIRWLKTSTQAGNLSSESGLASRDFALALDSHTLSAGPSVRV